MQLLVTCARAQTYQEDSESRDEDSLLCSESADEEERKTETVSAEGENASARSSDGSKRAGSPVEAEDERVSVALSGERLHHHRVESKAHLQRGGVGEVGEAASHVPPGQ